MEREQFNGYKEGFEDGHWMGMETIKYLVVQPLQKAIQLILKGQREEAYKIITEANNYMEFLFPKKEIM